MDLVCYKCKKPGRIKYDCLLYKSETMKGKKKEMVATQSDSKGDSFEEQKEKKVTNKCFMDLHDAFEDMRILKSLV